MKRTPLILIIVALLLIGCQSEQADTEPLPLVETGIDPESWALVPAGEFFMGRHEHETAVDHDYEIMVTDVTNSQYAEYLNAALDEGLVKVEAIFPAT